MAEVGRDLDRRGVDGAFSNALGARELVEGGLAELEDLGVVNRDHVDRVLVAVLQLPARGALGRAVDCAGKTNRRVSFVHPT